MCGVSIKCDVVVVKLLNSCQEPTAFWAADGMHAAMAHKVPENIRRMIFIVVERKEIQVAVLLRGRDEK